MKQTLLLVCILAMAIALSCKKDDGQPNPTPAGNLITANPTVTGVSGASVSVSGSTYTLTLPAGTNVKALKISILVASGSRVDPDPSIARDYTNPVSYTITAADGSQQTIRVTVVVEQAPKSSEKQITALSFAALNPVVQASIDQTTRKTTATVPASTDLTQLVPTLTVSSKATVSPASGVVQNFTNPVSYTVTAEDGSKQEYEVKVDKQAVVNSSVACLCVHEEYSSDNSTYSLDYSHDQNGRINKIKFIDLRGNKFTSEENIDYDQDGNLIRLYGKNTDFRFSYQNNKVIKMGLYDSNNKTLGDFIKEGVIKFNDKNEMIEINQSGFKDNYEYSNGNLIKAIEYDSLKKETKFFELTYDNKHNPIASSKPHGIFTFIFWSYGILHPLTSNYITLKASDSSRSYSLTYTYNKNNYPVEAKAIDANGKAILAKWTYANCQ
ncbi:DUF5018 domain-containing protein [Spirosoma fluminis]